MLIAQVVGFYGPVLDSALARRIACAQGIQKTGSRIRECVDALTTQDHLVAQEKVGTFYWSAGKGPETPVPFRRAADETTRTAVEICTLELVALAREVIARGKDVETTIVAMTQVLGGRRLGAASLWRFESAVGLVDV